MDGAVMGRGLLLVVKMCGNCNPAIESMQVAQRISQGLGAKIVPYGEGMVTLTLSACSVACVDERYPGPVRIQGLGLNGYPCRDQEELVAKATQALQQQLKRIGINIT